MHAMPSKLENALPLFISVRKCVGSVLTSGLTLTFTQIKVKDRYASQSEHFLVHLEKNYPRSKTPLGS